MFTKSLADTYDSQAQKFSSTRQKHRPEMDYITDAIKNCQKNNTWKSVTIVEVGCGDGRLLKHIDTQNIHYTGVDISTWLLEIAQKNNPNQTFTQQDMISYLESVEKGSVDIIVGIASMQHLFPHSERQKFFDLAHQALKPWWLLILTNRARSDRAKEKYSRSRNFHLRQRFRTSFHRASGDQMVPRKDTETQKTYQRYYHFFSLDELQNHLTKGRDTQTLQYVHKDGSLTESVCLARNSLLIARKNA